MMDSTGPRQRRGVSSPRSGSPRSPRSSARSPIRVGSPSPSRSGRGHNLSPVDSSGSLAANSGKRSASPSHYHHQHHQAQQRGRASSPFSQQPQHSRPPSSSAGLGYKDDREEGTASRGGNRDGLGTGMRSDYGAYHGTGVSSTPSRGSAGSPASGSGNSSSGSGRRGSPGSDGDEETEYGGDITGYGRGVGRR